MQLFNTLTHKIEEFTPLNPPIVTFYSCGPTVYDFTHIGHMRTFVNNDVLKRSLNFLGYKVKHVINITDVGHLSSDADSGEDKMEKGAKKSNKTVWEVAQYYTDYFVKTINALNIVSPNVLCKATDNVTEMIELTKILVNKKFAYETKEAVYFDVAKFPKYGQLSQQKLEDKLKGSREEVYVDSEKKNPADFALWFKRVGRFANHTMHWNSPWGDGFPGWHIECSAMSMKCLGETIDLHSGGIDHIPVHHENEIAQSEAATGKQFVRYWVHFQFLMVDGKKMSKSLNNFYTLDDIIKHGIDPLALRLLFLQTHYSQVMNFTWESVTAANDAFKNLKSIVLSLKSPSSLNARTSLSQEKLSKIDDFRQQFITAISNNLQTSQALAVMWSMLKSNIPSTDKLDLLYDFDLVFGLRLNEITEERIPDEILALKKDYEQSRQQKDFTKSDKIRKQINDRGFEVRDTPSETILTKK